MTIGEVNSEDSTIDCVKGRSYKLYELMLGCDSQTTESKQYIQELLENVKSRNNRLLYTVIYLSPSNYHRFHSPAICTADYRRHIVGYLTPVKKSYVLAHPDTFKSNERVNIFGRWTQGFFFQSAVGALNVGSIKLDFDKQLITNMTVPHFPYFEDKNYKLNEKNRVSPFSEYLN